MKTLNIVLHNFSFFAEGTHVFDASNFRVHLIYSIHIFSLLDIYKALQTRGSNILLYISDRDNEKF
jgi:hypothetical protein